VRSGPPSTGVAVGSDTVLGVGGLTKPWLEIDSSAMWCGGEDKRRDMEGPSLAMRFFLRKLDGSSRERVDDGDGWSSESFDGCDGPLAGGNVGDDVGDCVNGPSALSNFVGLASRSLSLSFTLVVVELV
jgi:hypothetical protein